MNIESLTKQIIAAVSEDEALYDLLNDDAVAAIARATGETVDETTAASVSKEVTFSIAAKALGESLDVLSKAN